MQLRIAIAGLVIVIVACSQGGEAAPPAPRAPAKQPTTAAEWRAHHLRFGDGIEESGLHFWKPTFLRRDKTGNILDGESPVHNAQDRTVAILRCDVHGCRVLLVGADNTIGVTWKELGSTPMDPRQALQSISKMTAAAPR